MTHELEAEAIIEAFNRFSVNYVVVCAFAAIAQNVPVPPTMDIDFLAAPDRLNLQRLSDALEYLHARIRVIEVDEGIEFDRSPQMLGKMQMLNLTCKFGEFDVLFEASGIQDFHDVEKNSLSVLVGGTRTQVASVDDIARSKRTAGRIKDLTVLHIFEKCLKGRENDHGLEI